jgi:hypothetical protein
MIARNASVDKVPSVVSLRFVAICNVERNSQLKETAGPSTALRFAQDDRFVRCASLRLTELCAALCPG